MSTLTNGRFHAPAAVVPVEQDIPLGMTLDEYRRHRSRERAHGQKRWWRR